MGLKEKRKKRAKRVRDKIFGTASLPRLSVFRSNKRIYAQVIDDAKGTTLVLASDLKLKGKMTKVEKAKKVGEEVGEELKKLGIKQIVFDRDGFLYHGRVRALAEGVRLKGVKI